MKDDAFVPTLVCLITKSLARKLQSHVAKRFLHKKYEAPHLLHSRSEFYSMLVHLTAFIMI